jgi:hypothetical protein
MWLPPEETREYATQAMTRTTTLRHLIQQRISSNCMTRQNVIEQNTEYNLLGSGASSRYPSCQK